MSKRTTRPQKCSPYKFEQFWYWYRTLWKIKSNKLDDARENDLDNPFWPKHMSNTEQPKTRIIKRLEAKKCPRCLGSGIDEERDSPDHPCPVCDGEGFIWRTGIYEQTWQLVLKHMSRSEITDAETLVLEQRCPNCGNDGEYDPVTFISYDEEGVWFKCHFCKWNRTLPVWALKEAGFYNVVGAFPGY